MQSKTNVIMVSSWVLLSSHAVENGCRHYFNMDAVVTTSKWGPNKTMNFRQFDWEKNPYHSGNANMEPIVY